MAKQLKATPKKSVPQPSTVVRKKAMLDALQKSAGIVTRAAQAIELDPGTHYRWLKEDEDYQAAVAALDNYVLDIAETALLNRIKDGDTTAIIFMLKTKGRKRGYVETKTIETGDGGPLKIIIDSLI